MLQILVSNDRPKKCTKMKIILLVCLAGFCGLAQASERPKAENLENSKAKSMPRSPVIQTKYGQVQGRILTFKGTRLQPVAVFKGIPYATPPVGSNRY